ncbi:MAG: hypothetical protein II453_07200 [Alphaproteobacteria bacterium]|nr:hypothetical protein [Alphaproteobacteria bacterium]
MYIGKVEIKDEWEKLEDLIKAKVEGQSSFAFDSDTKYQLQCEGSFGARFCESAATPDDKNEGFCIIETQVAYYKPGTDDLYVKTKHGSYGLLKIGTLGE